ncbi:MAG: GNAT family N-acetyltransferase [Actinomycetota bacterium]
MVRWVLDRAATPSVAEVNEAYGWAEWPAREPWRVEAVSRSCRWLAARDAGTGELLGLVRLLDDGGLHASLWDLLVRPDVRRQGIGRALAEAALAECADRRLVVVVSTPEAVALFAALGFRAGSHGHAALYLRPGH